jgi:hypothetical protein
MHKNNLQKKVYISLGVLIAIYIFASFFTPIDQQTLDTFHISAVQLRLIDLPALFIVAAIWTCTAYGFAHFKQYALLIKNSSDGKGINTLANGLGFIVLQLVVTGMFSSITAIQAVENGLGRVGNILVISTFLGLVLNIVSFYVLRMGAGQLVRTLKNAKPNNSNWLIAFAAVSAVYLYLISNGYPPTSVTDSIYHHLSLPAALVLVGLGNIVSWYLALSAAFRLSYYQNHVQGVIYKSALRLFARGVYFIVGCSILAQILSTFTTALEDLELAPILVVLYILVAIIGAGFVFIAQSAKKLRKIEEL